MSQCCLSLLHFVVWIGLVVCLCWCCSYFVWVLGLSGCVGWCFVGLCVFVFGAFMCLGVSVCFGVCGCLVFVGLFDSWFVFSLGGCVVIALLLMGFGVLLMLFVGFA